MTEQRLIDLETKFAHQEFLIEELNQAVYEQQKTIAKMEATISSLVKRYQDILGGGDEIRPNEKPPHY